jgi:hypothetical protein
MSRTRKGGKAPGYEFWSARPGRGGRGRHAKNITHRVERRINRDTARRAAREHETGSTAVEQ